MLSAIPIHDRHSATYKDWPRILAHYPGGCDFLTSIIYRRWAQTERSVVKEEGKEGEKSGTCFKVHTFP